MMAELTEEQIKFYNENMPEAREMYYKQVFDQLQKRIDDKFDDIFLKKKEALTVINNEPNERNKKL